MTAEVADGTTVADLVEAQARRGPEAVAVVSGERRLTYGELEARANQLAHHLRGLGVGRDTVVGVCAERSPEMAVGLLGVLKAGGACLPLDPGYPAQRLSFMLGDALPAVVLTHERAAAALPEHDAAVVRLDADWEQVARRPPAPPARHAGPGDVAYVIYTSGSTGEPKGVMLTHRGLVNHHLAAARLYGLGPADRVLQFCSVSFDVSVEELFPTWATGGAVVLRPDDRPILGREWRDWLAAQRVSVLNLPTGYWHEWVRDLAARGDTIPESLRLVVVGGDKALGPAYATWLKVGGDRARWVNAYGPTEASVMATVYEPPQGAAVHGDPPIGRPLPGLAVHLLDEGGRAVAAGEPGEIHIGGVGVARGYLRRPQLTAERFVPDPFSVDAGARMYRTGDLGRWRPDGNLEFLGRLDDQVKVRGFRVECGEVEAVLATAPQVAEAVVVAREDAPGDKRLVAYVVPSGPAAPTPRELRRHLADRLPDYMVPTGFVTLDAFPLTPNGKLDRDALPPPARSRGDQATPMVPPRTPTEARVARIWAEVLGVEEVGVDDDFFELGGHSLLATQVVARLREALGTDLPLSAVFTAPTVAGVAAALEEAAGPRSGVPALVAQPRTAATRIPLSLAQEHLWALEARADPPGLYNVTVRHSLPGPVDEAALRPALAHLVERHETLRTAFATDAGGPHQRVAPSAPVELAVTDLRHLPRPEAARQVAAHEAADNARPFDLGAPPLFRAHLVRVGDDASELIATFDHLVSDGTSAHIFVGELTRAYRAFAGRRAPQLRPLAVQYADFAIWQRRWLTEDRLEAQVEYWQRKLAGMPLGPAVPFDHVPDHPTRRVASHPFRVPPELHLRLSRVARGAHGTVFVACVGAVQALFAALTGRDDVVLSTTLSGRNRAELEGLVGFFAGVGRLRTDLSGDPTLQTVLARARETVVGLFDHQDVPFPKVRERLFPDFPVGESAVALASVLPTEIHYVRAAHDEWLPGATWVEHPPPDPGPTHLYVRGQLHPLSVTFVDDGHEMWGELRSKPDFYDEGTIDRLARGLEAVLATVASHPGARLSELSV